MLVVVNGAGAVLGQTRVHLQADRLTDVELLDAAPGYGVLQWMVFDAETHASLASRLVYRLRPPGVGESVPFEPLSKWLRSDAPETQRRLANQIDEMPHGQLQADQRSGLTHLLGLLGAGDYGHVVTGNRHEVEARHRGAVVESDAAAWRSRRWLAQAVLLAAGVALLIAVAAATTRRAAWRQWTPLLLAASVAAMLAWRETPKSRRGEADRNHRQIVQAEPRESRNSALDDGAAGASRSPQRDFLPDSGQVAAGQTAQGDLAELGDTARQLNRLADDGAPALDSFGGDQPQVPPQADPFNNLADRHSDARQLHERKSGAAPRRSERSPRQPHGRIAGYDKARRIEGRLEGRLETGRFEAFRQGHAAERRHVSRRGASRRRVPTQGVARGGAAERGAAGGCNEAWIAGRRRVRAGQSTRSDRSTRAGSASIPRAIGIAAGAGAARGGAQPSSSRNRKTGPQQAAVRRAFGGSR